MSTTNTKGEEVKQIDIASKPLASIVEDCKITGSGKKRKLNVFSKTIEEGETAITNLPISKFSQEDHLQSQIAEIEKSKAFNTKLLQTRAGVLLRAAAEYSNLMSSESGKEILSAIVALGKKTEASINAVRDETKAAIDKSSEDAAAASKTTIDNLTSSLNRLENQLNEINTWRRTAGSFIDEHKSWSSSSGGPSPPISQSGSVQPAQKEISSSSSDEIANAYEMFFKEATKDEEGEAK